MSGFLDLFGLVKFDENGNVCENREQSIGQMRSNYLYLISKYNQEFLLKGEVPEFFKVDLGNVLNSVEKGGDFEKAKEDILQNCLPQVREIAKKSTSDKNFISNMSDLVEIKDKTTLDRLAKAKNNLQQEYILVRELDPISFNVEKMLRNSDLSDKKEKSKLFKEIIKYNSYVSTAEKARESVVLVEEQQKMIG